MQCVQENNEIRNLSQNEIKQENSFRNREDIQNRADLGNLQWLVNWQFDSRTENNNFGNPESSIGRSLTNQDATQKSSLGEFRIVEVKANLPSSHFSNEDEKYINNDEIISTENTTEQKISLCCSKNVVYYNVKDHQPQRKSSPKPKPVNYQSPAPTHPLARITAPIPKTLQNEVKQIIKTENIPENNKPIIIYTENDTEIIEPKKPRRFSPDRFILLNNCTVRRFARPPFTYLELIRTAIEESPTKRLTVAQIYEWISDHFPYFSRTDDRWKSVVRQKLSTQMCFHKCKRDRSVKGLGHAWYYLPEATNVPTHPFITQYIPVNNMDKYAETRLHLKCNCPLSKKFIDGQQSYEEIMSQIPAQEKIIIPAQEKIIIPRCKGKVRGPRKVISAPLPTQKIIIPQVVNITEISTQHKSTISASIQLQHKLLPVYYLNAEDGAYLSVLKPVQTSYIQNAIKEIPCEDPQYILPDWSNLEETLLQNNIP